MCWPGCLSTLAAMSVTVGPDLHNLSVLPQVAETKPLVTGGVGAFSGTNSRLLRALVRRNGRFQGRSSFPNPAHRFRLGYVLVSLKQAGLLIFHMRGPHQWFCGRYRGRMTVVGGSCRA